MLAGDEPALPVAGVAVGVVGGLAEDIDRARLLVPPHDAVVGDVAPEEVAAVAEPNRPLAPAEPRREPLDGGAGQAIAGEGGIEDLDRRVGITLAGLPHGTLLRANRPKGCRSGFSEPRLRRSEAQWGKAVLRWRKARAENRPIGRGF